MKICSDCNWCGDFTYCKNFKDKLRNYGGLRFTADGFDCALPVSFDTFSTCSYNCLYCFSNFLVRDPHKKGEYKVGVQNLKILEKFLTFDPTQISQEYRIMQNALRRENGRCPIQWGALGDPFDNIERWQAMGTKIINLFIKYNQPVRISTKGGLVLQHQEYLEALAQRPELFWVAFSIISTDDEILNKIDLGCPTSSIRFKAMKELNKIGCKVSLRMRPIIPNVSDRTIHKRKIWKELLEKAKDAGAKAVSCEFLFAPLIQPPHIKARMRQLEQICQIPLTKFYKESTYKKGACLRGSRYWKQDMVFAIRNYAHQLGMTFAISDPHWKEYNDTGCCCGILPSDPVFGNWQRESATNRLIETKAQYEKTGKGIIYFKDINPVWAKDISLTTMVCITKVRGAVAKKHSTWETKLQEQWNDLKYYRNPAHYFGGVLTPDGIDQEGNRIFRYVALPPQKIKTSWDI